MQKPGQIFYQSLISTNRHRRWWILALSQILGFFIIGQLSRHYFFFYPWLLVMAVVVSPVTVWLWLDIEAKLLGPTKSLSANWFINRCLTASIIIIFSNALIIFFKLLLLSWVFLTLISSLIAATAALAMLYVVLCDQSFIKAWALAFDTWHKKISLAVLAALVLVIAHGLSFIFAHTFFRRDLRFLEFSVFPHSATIWMLFIVVIFAAAYLTAFLNCFLVRFFLDVISRKKDKETVEQSARSMAELSASI